MRVAASRCLEMRDDAGVLPVGQRQLGAGLETTRSFAHAEMELKIRDAHARIGGVHSMGLASGQLPRLGETRLAPPPPARSGSLGLRSTRRALHPTSVSMLPLAGVARHHPQKSKAAHQGCSRHHLRHPGIRMPIPHEADSDIISCSLESSGIGPCRWKSGHTLRQPNLKLPSRPQRYAAPSPISLAPWSRKQMPKMDASWVLIDPLSAPRQNRELDWLVEELRETLTNLKHGLEDCYALLAPIDPGSTLVLSTPRNEIVKGHVTRVGTRIVKGVCSLLARMPSLQLTLATLDDPSPPAHSPSSDPHHQPRPPDPPCASDNPTRPPHPVHRPALPDPLILVPISHPVALHTRRSPTTVPLGSTPPSLPIPLRSRRSHQRRPPHYCRPVVDIPLRLPDSLSPSCPGGLFLLLPTPLAELPP